MTLKPVPLHVAIRVFPAFKRKEQKIRANKVWRLPRAMFVFDTETRTDESQRLTFGSYRFLVDDELREEGLFYADDLPAKDRKTLERYVAEKNRQGGRLLLLERREFLKKFYKAVYKGRALLVGFNLPFDLSRIASAGRAARGRFAGGFSLALWSYIKNGIERPDPHRPGIGIKHIDSKRALKGFTARFGADQADLIPEDSVTGEPKKGYKFRGHMLDLRTLAFAMTDRSYTLDSACQAFGVEHGKQHVAQHGVVTHNYIDYNRRDVLATAELAIKLLAEYSKHPIHLQPTKAYSPASIGKSYLHGMGITPILERQSDFPEAYLGYAQTAFFGGRTSAHIRKVPVPVVYVDFLSMYPTVNSLMDLRQFLVASEVRVKHCRAEVEHFLGQLTPAKLFCQETWKHFPAFVKLIPNGDLLPSRGKYSVASNDWQVALNYLYESDHAPSKALWFSLPDVAASVVLTRKAPTIVDAFKIIPHGKLTDLRPIRLGGEVSVNPLTQDLFRTVIEQRKSLSKRNELSKADVDRLDKALKVLANATSYGIFAEMNRQETEKRTKVMCRGLDPEPYFCSVIHPEQPGEFCFPPLASLITGAARLMLALLEYCVTQQGGTYAMEDTDSMAIVSTEREGLVPCPGGNSAAADGQQAVKALSWGQVNRIVKKFEALNPYRRNIIPGSVLKIEDDNYDPETGRQRQLHCYAISAKRYALFLWPKQGKPALLKERVNNKKDRWSRHGLGHLLNPTDPDADDRNWTAAVWETIIRKGCGQKTTNLKFANRPAIGRTSVSSPFLMKSFEKLNAGKLYADQVKPFNFLQTAHVIPFGHPNGANPEKFHLITPYDSDPRTWLEKEWIDQHSKKRFRITTQGHCGSRQAARVKTYGDVVTEYEFHPESKCADANGNPCERQTIGLLQRRHIKVDQLKCIGKESNSLESVDDGLEHSAQNIYTEYVDPRRTEWVAKLQPALKSAKLQTLVRLCKYRLSRREIIELRAGRTSKPHQKTRELLAEILRTLGLL